MRKLSFLCTLVLLLLVVYACNKHEDGDVMNETVLTDVDSLPDVGKKSGINFNLQRVVSCYNGVAAATKQPYL